MKTFIDEQNAAGSDIKLPSISRKDIIGKDISDLPGVFQVQCFSPVWSRVVGDLGRDMIWMVCVPYG